MSTVLFLNMLIAMLTRTFDMNVERSAQNYQFLFASNVVSAVDLPLVPPPLSFLGLPYRLLAALVRSVSALVYWIAWRVAGYERMGADAEENGGSKKQKKAADLEPLTDKTPSERAQEVLKFLRNPNLEQVQEEHWRRQSLAATKAVEDRLTAKVEAENRELKAENREMRAEIREVKGMLVKLMKSQGLEVEPAAEAPAAAAAAGSMSSMEA